MTQQGYFILSIFVVNSNIVTILCEIADTNLIIGRYSLWNLWPKIRETGCGFKNLDVAKRRSYWI